MTLAWDNGQGLVFTRTIAVDGQYMFTVTDSVENKSGAKVALYPYRWSCATGYRSIRPLICFTKDSSGVANDKLQDPAYDHFKDAGTPPETFDSTGGWVGITDKYWMAAVVPPQDEKYNGAFRLRLTGEPSLIRPITVSQGTRWRRANITITRSCSLAPKSLTRCATMKRNRESNVSIWPSTGAGSSS